MELLNKLMGFLNSAVGMSATIALLIEFALRMFKSEKPLSLAYAFGAFCKKLGELFTAMGAFLDKVLPQRVAKSE